MLRQAEIIIKSPGDGQADFVSMGTVDSGKLGYTISYDESELTGVPGSGTTIGVSEDMVTVTKTGELATTLVFEPGRDLSAVVVTPYGQLEGRLSTKKAAYTLQTGPEGESMLVELRYELIWAEQKLEHELNIECRMLS